MSEPFVNILRDGDVATVELNRPDANNGVSPDMTNAIGAALRELETDDRAKVVVLTGKGRMFSAGGNLGALVAGLPTRDLDLERRNLWEAHSMIGYLLHYPKPTIARINGPAAGGGLAYALACDRRIASEKAKLVYAYGLIGLSGDLGVNWLISRLIGAGKGRAFAFSPGADGRQALQIGLVDEVAAPDALDAAVARSADYMRKIPSFAANEIKRNLETAATIGFTEMAEMESASFQRCRGSEDHRLALEALLNGK